MGQEKTVSQELTELRARVVDWRKGGGGRGSRIPEDLWQEAIRVAAMCGLYATAKALHFSYDRLKERCEEGGREGVVAAEKRRGEVVRSGEANGGRGIEARSSEGASSVGGPTDAGSRFVALPMPALQTGSLTTIELAGRTGDRMRVEMTGDIDVASLVQAFWSRQS
jgi:hypothetical protein